MPDDHQGSRQVSPWLLPGQQLDPGSDRHRYAYDTSAVVHSRSPSRSTPDASSAPFPWCSSPRLIHRSNPRWFTASPCRAAVEGPPPSPAQHRNHQRDLLHRNLQPRSWRTIVRIADDPPRRQTLGSSTLAFVAGGHRSARLPRPVQVLPKPGGAGKVRKLGIPVVADRVVQAALKLVLEPIFEADFLPVSYGFRGRPVDATPTRCA